MRHTFSQLDQDNSKLALDLSESDSAYAIQPSLTYTFELYKDGVLTNQVFTDEAEQALTLTEFGHYEWHIQLTNFFDAESKIILEYPFLCSIELVPEVTGYYL